METIVVATKNPGKAREYAEMLAPKGIESRRWQIFPPLQLMKTVRHLKKMR